MRHCLLAKTNLAISTAKESCKFTPAQAAKLYGLLNFLENGMFGRVGCGGLTPIKDRQYSRETSLTKSIIQSFDIIQAVLSCQPKRRLWLTNAHWSRVVAASDAAQDAPLTGSGGYLILWGLPCDRPREAFVATIDDSLFSWFTPGNQKIAQLEMLMVAHALINRASSFRKRRGFWFIDNVASLMCLVRGRSDSDDLEKIARFIHVVLFALEAMLFWEYIPTKSNWADPISRLGARDPWHANNGFALFQSELMIQLLDLPFSAIVRCVQFL